MTNFCEYYLIKVDKSRSWMLSAVFKSFEHLSFDRTIDKENALFEFFVPQGNEVIFLEVIKYFKSIGLVLEYHKEENRLKFTEFV